MRCDTCVVSAAHARLFAKRSFPPAGGGWRKSCDSLRTGKMGFAQTSQGKKQKTKRQKDGGTRTEDTQDVSPR